MFSLHYIYNTDTTDDIEVYSIYSKLFKKFLGFTTIRINRTEKQICFSNFNELSIDMCKDIYILIKESKEELDIEGIIGIGGGGLLIFGLLLGAIVYLFKRGKDKNS